VDRTFWRDCSGHTTSYCIIGRGYRQFLSSDGRSDKIRMDQYMDGFPLNPQILSELVTVRMPFGKYKDRIICDLPESYLVWFYRKGFPRGEIGTLLSTLYEIRLNGLEYLLKPIKREKTPG
jgi:uncharacterized protein (DUF3820 family)